MQQLPAVAGPPDVFRALHEVVPLDECDVYSWFPEPEYDPHLQGDDEEESDDEFGVVDETAGDDQMGHNMDDMDIDQEPTWGQAGMELDDVPESVPMGKTKSAQGDRRKSSGGPSMTAPGRIRDTMNLEDIGAKDRRLGHLLWSSNYFFYSR